MLKNHGSLWTLMTALFFFFLLRSQWNVSCITSCVHLGSGSLVLNFLCVQLQRVKLCWINDSLSQEHKTLWNAWVRINRSASWVDDDLYNKTRTNPCAWCFKLVFGSVPDNNKKSEWTWTRDVSISKIIKDKECAIRSVLSSSRSKTSWNEV